MGSKALLSLGICLAILFMISSEVVARELAETDSLKSDNKNEVHVDGRSGYNGIGEDGRGGSYCRYGCCKKGYKGCKKCCKYAGQAMDEVTEANPHN